MLHHLRDRHHQPSGGGLLGEEGAEVDGFGLHRVQSRVDRGEQGAPARGVFRRVGDAKALADDVVQLRRVEPDMRMGKCQSVRHQPRARHAQGQAGMIIRLGKRNIEQVEQRLRRRQRVVPSAHQGVGEHRYGSRLRPIGTGCDLSRHGIPSKCHPFRQRLPRGQNRNLGMQPQQLQPLHFQPQPQGDPPTDIGPAIGVVANPTRQDHGPRRQFRPAIRPGASGDGDQGRVEPIDRIPAIDDGGDDAGELLQQGDAARAVGVERRHWAAGCALGQGRAGFGVHGEGRMRGKDRGETCPLNHRAIFGPADWAVVRIGTEDLPVQTGQRDIGRRWVNATEIGRNAVGTITERRIPQMPDQRRDVIQRDRAGIDLPRDCQRNQQHRIPKRVLRRSAAQPCRQVHEILGKDAGPIGGRNVWHESMLANFVRRSKAREEETPA